MNDKCIYCRKTVEELNGLTRVTFPGTGYCLCTFCFEKLGEIGLDPNARLSSTLSKRGVARPLDFRRSADRRLRAKVYERDGYTCQGCGVMAREVPMNYDGRSALYAANGDYLVVDHIVPRSAGGTNAIDNLQTLCDRCNSVKGSTIDKERKAHE